MMGDLTRNFSSYEFACPCCGEAHMDVGFMGLLQELRTRYGKPFSVVKGGGYRCKKYADKLTAHNEGKAVDPDIPREDYHQVVGIALRIGFSGIGLKQKGGRFQMHLDTSEPILPIRPRPWLWTY